MYYVYFLRLNNGDVYVGSTNNLRARVKRHEDGQVPSTRPHLPCSLLTYIAVLDEPTARSLKHYFKSGSGKAFAYKRL
jgi:putative endonuclease